MRLILLTMLLLALSGLGGGVAEWIKAPMPWMLGSLAVAGGIAIFWRGERFRGYSFPIRLRSLFVALIGVMIGTQVTPELLGKVPELPWTLAALVLFVAASMIGNYLIFHRFGGYDRTTAFYAATPGGLIESIVQGEAAGADLRILTMQQFLRVILVIVSVPLGLSLWFGFPVGSAAGLAGAGASGPVDLPSLILIVAAGLFGMWAARQIRLPAPQITGPMVLTTGLTGFGVIDLQLPIWLIALAQVVIGCSLGLRFAGMDLQLVRRCLGMSAVSVTYMLTLGTGVALALQAFTGVPFLHLFISFAPGGVAEMGVIALSLAASPAFVSLHHIARILMTVIGMAFIGRVLQFDK